VFEVLETSLILVSPHPPYLIQYQVIGKPSTEQLLLSLRSANTLSPSYCHLLPIIVFYLVSLYLCWSPPIHFPHKIREIFQLQMKSLIPHLTITPLNRSMASHGSYDKESNLWSCLEGTFCLCLPLPSYLRPHTSMALMSGTLDILLVQKRTMRGCLARTHQPPSLSPVLLIRISADHAIP